MLKCLSKRKRSRKVLSIAFGACWPSAYRLFTPAPGRIRGTANDDTTIAAVVDTGHDGECARRSRPTAGSFCGEGLGHR